MRATILDHYNSLKFRDLDKWNEFNAELARTQKFSHFIRSVCKKDKKLSKIDFVVGSLMIQYLDFTPENLKTDVIPELPESVLNYESVRNNNFRLAA